MPSLSLGYVEPSLYADGDLVVNGTAMGETLVDPGDTSGALSGWLNGLDGITASVNGSGEMTIGWTGPLVVDGIDPTGGGCLVDLTPGTYE
jgi:hypothetical protein